VLLTFFFFASTLFFSPIGQFSHAMCPPPVTVQPRLCGCQFFILVPAVFSDRVVFSSGPLLPLHVSFLTPIPGPTSMKLFFSVCQFFRSPCNTLFDKKEEFLWSFNPFNDCPVLNLPHSVTRAVSPPLSCSRSPH